MTRYHASWIVPISRPPIRDGWVEIDRGRISAVGGPSGRARPLDAPRVRSDELVVAAEHDLGAVALMPGLVNAHTHLELSYLRDQVPPAAQFVSWVRGVMAARRLHPDPFAKEIVDSLGTALREATASGTVLVGDISNTLVTFGPLARSPLAAVVFYEIIRFDATGADTIVDDAIRRIRSLTATDLVRPALAAHAPYSVSPAAFRALRRGVEHEGLSPWSVHLSESREECEFIARGSGPWRSLLEELRAWDPSWTPAAVSPVEYLEREGVLDSHVLAVHGVQMSAADLRRLAARGSSLVTCPRSNMHTGAGVPPIEAFYASGVRVAVGTDSLASAPDLNLFSELSAMHRLAPSVPASRLLDSATSQGARALGFESEFGAIEPGKRARLLAVDVPPGETDVERYLVSGIRPEQIRWIP